MKATPWRYRCDNCNLDLLQIQRFKYTEAKIENIIVKCGKCGKLVSITTGLFMYPMTKK